MITPFEVYIVMQADSVRETTVTIALVLGFFSLCRLLFGALEDKEKSILAVKKAAIGFVVLLGFAAIFPSTKTMAAMIVIPAIVNNKALQKEAGDLYKIAKQALAGAVGEEKKDD